MLRTLRTGTPEGKAALEAVLARRGKPDFDALRDALPIVEDVLSGGAPALARRVAELDGAAIAPEGLLVTPEAPPRGTVPPAFVSAFRLARKRLTRYHALQRPAGFNHRDEHGSAFAERPVPHARAGVYVPGGRAFYPSSLLMGVVPARAAGVPEVVVATPPRAYHESAALRWALCEAGVDRVLLAGGAHGIAGLVSVCGCTKVVGPGNRWVAAAKHLVSGLVSVDLPAGPSEVLIVATADAPPDLVAADLLAQAEHDPEALCLLFTDSAALARAVDRELGKQLEGLPTAATARTSLERHGLALVFRSIDAAAREGCGIAAEHVQLFGKGAEKRANALAATSGAVFVGAGTPTAFGDYLAGPNHVLPTGGAARSFSGLSTRDFVRWGRTVAFSRRGTLALAPDTAVFAAVEELPAHARSAARRLPAGDASPRVRAARGRRT